jgi:hypothetical protein
MFKRRTRLLLFIGRLYRSSNPELWYPLLPESAWGGVQGALTSLQFRGFRLNHEDVKCSTLEHFGAVETLLMHQSRMSPCKACELKRATTLASMSSDPARTTPDRFLGSSGEPNQ